MSDIVWEDPPDARVHQRNCTGVWDSILEPLKAHPKRWAVVRIGSTSQVAASTAHNLRTGKVRRPPGSWEFVSRHTKVYARYLGPEDAS